jgi:hypothetical protein
VNCPAGNQKPGLPHSSFALGCCSGKKTTSNPHEKKKAQQLRDPGQATRTALPRAAVVSTGTGAEDGRRDEAADRGRADAGAAAGADNAGSPTTTRPDCRRRPDATRSSSARASAACCCQASGPHRMPKVRAVVLLNSKFPDLPCRIAAPSPLSPFIIGGLSSQQSRPKHLSFPCP